MEKTEILKEIEQYAWTAFKADSTGHDFFHMKRVAQMAVRLAHETNGNPFICEAAGWLHDIGDKKLFRHPEKAKADMKAFLSELPINPEDREAIGKAMASVSFQAGHEVPQTLEGKIVQDADRLDALGAIGIARTFAFGGAKGQMIHGEDGDVTSIRHFHDKLFKLKNLINTPAARKIAEERHQVMEEFIEQFYREWNSRI